MSFKPSFLEGMSPPSVGAVLKAFAASVVELGIGIMFFSIYSESVQFLNNTYLTDLPIIGLAFESIAPDANASHLVCALLAAFSVMTPLFIWSQVFEHEILDNAQEWFSHPQNKVIAGLCGFIMVLVVGMECVSLYTLIAHQSVSAGGGFIQADQSGVMAWLADNKGMAVGVSLMIAVINITLALFCVQAFRALKPAQEV